MPTAAAVDFGALLKDIPPGAWVAISTDETHVVAYSADLNDALAKAKQSGEEHPVVIRVPETPTALLL